MKSLKIPNFRFFFPIEKKKKIFRYSVGNIEFYITDSSSIPPEGNHLCFSMDGLYIYCSIYLQFYNSSLLRSISTNFQKEKVTALRYDMARLLSYYGLQLQYTNDQVIINIQRELYHRALQESNITLEQMATQFNISKNTLMRRWKKVVSFTFKQYFLWIKVQLATDYWDDHPDLTVQDVVRLCNFRNVKQYEELRQKYLDSPQAH